MVRLNISEWIEEDNLIKLKVWARDGYTDEQIASKIGISRQTLYRWRKQAPELDKTLKEGKEIADIEVENALFKKVVGGYYEETKEEIKTYPDGTEVIIKSTYKRYQAPDTTALIFWLKNRQPDKWYDRKPVEETKDNQDKQIVRYIELLDDTLLEA